MKLISLCTSGTGRITKHLDTITKMNNGIEYYCVEVTSKDGIQYGIQVFGEEAIALYNITMKIIQDTMNMEMIQVLHQEQLLQKFWMRV